MQHLSLRTHMYVVCIAIRIIEFLMGRKFRIARDWKCIIVFVSHVFFFVHSMKASLVHFVETSEFIKILRGKIPIKFC